MNSSEHSSKIKGHKDPLPAFETPYIGVLGLHVVG